jgi:hypothetical protein
MFIKLTGQKIKIGASNVGSACTVVVGFKVIAVSG